MGASSRPRNWLNDDDPEFPGCPPPYPEVMLYAGSEQRNAMSPATAGNFPPDEQTIAIQRQAGHRVVPGAIIVLAGAGAGGPEQAVR
jgi:hypothetical protein